MGIQKAPPFVLDVVIVEDDPEIRVALRFVLEGEGYRCAEAGNGREALEIARQHPPRLMLLDLMMPELDGLETARQLQAGAQTHDIHLVCVTARSDQAARREAKRVGCEIFLTKPVDTAALLDVVNLAMNS